MGTSKIMFGNAGIDLTQDTVTASKLLKGYTAHDKNGDIIVGTAEQGGGSSSIFKLDTGYSWNTTASILGDRTFKNLAFRNNIGYAGGPEDKEIKFKINDWTVNNTLAFSFNDLSSLSLLYCEPSIPTIIGHDNNIGGFFQGAFAQTLAGVTKNDVNIQILTDGDSGNYLYVQTVVINVHIGANIYQYYMHDLGNLLYLGDRENSIKLTTSGLYLNGNLLDDSVKYAKFNLATRLNSINKDEMFIYANGNNLYVNGFSDPGNNIPLYDYAVVEGKSYRPNSINNTFWAGSTDGWTHLNGSWTTSGTGLPGKESIGNHLVLDSVNEIYEKPSTTIASTSLFSSSEIIRPQIGWCTGNLNVLNNIEIISL